MASSTNDGYSIPNRFTNARAETTLSRVYTPRNCTSGCFTDNSWSAGASARHGEHHDAQTLSTNTFPALAVKVPPSSVGPETTGASLRSAWGIKVATPFPAIKDCSLVLNAPPFEQASNNGISKKSRYFFISSSAAVSAPQVHYRRAPQLFQMHQSADL